MIWSFRLAATCTNSQLSLSQSRTLFPSHRLNLLYNGLDGPRIVARISELSSRGCYVDTFNPFPVGTVLRVRIRYGCSTCELPGNVIYTHTNYGMGLRFGETSAENRATLDAWLEELARKSA